MGQQSTHLGVILAAGLGLAGAPTTAHAQDFALQVGPPIAVMPSPGRTA